MFNSPERTTNLGHHSDVVPAVKDVPFGSKADICSAKRHVRFTPESGHVRCNQRCPLWANSGRRRLLNHLVGDGNHARRNGDAECLGGC